MRWLLKHLPKYFYLLLNIGSGLWLYWIESGHVLRFGRFSSGSNWRFPIFAKIFAKIANFTDISVQLDGSAELCCASSPLLSWAAPSAWNPAKQHQNENAKIAIQQLARDRTLFNLATGPGHASSMSTITSSPESKRASSFPLGLCWTSVSARKSIKFPTHVLICAKKAIKIPLLCEIKSAMGEKTVELKRCFWPRGKRSTTVFTICQHVVWCAREAWHLVFHSGCTAVLYNFTHSDN